MKYVYAAMMLHEIGKDITADAIKNVLAAASTEIIDEKIELLIASLEGVDINDAVKDAQVVAPQPTVVEVAVEESVEEPIAQSPIGLDLLFGN